jgi:5'-deoxynucleotidase YfbR-like HD superfamily hydrolase
VVNTEKSLDNVLKKLEFLFERYSNEMRAMTQPYLLQRVISGVSDYNYHPDDNIVRESLMEHIGSLPVVAIELYPHIEDPEVDLGETLTMLAVHDIGELITHDEMTFTKTAASKDPEREAALSLLDASYHGLYEDVESQKSKSAKFAKSVDKITPDLFELCSPADITLRRYEYFLGLTNISQIIQKIESKKQPYMNWNSFMLDLHKLLMVRLRQKLLKE